MAAEFSSFKKRQLIFEVRFDDAYALWDRTGIVWTTLQPTFRKLKAVDARPDRAIFHADDRYIINVALQRLAITDCSPDASWTKTFETVRVCFEAVASILELRLLNRVGTRFQYTMDTKTMESARKQAAEYSWALSPGVLFRVEPKSVSPWLKLEVDDGEVGYLAQVYPEERKLEIEAPPNAIAMGLGSTTKTIAELVFDLDCMTKKPMPVEGFNVMPWLSGWQSAINRDANALLNLGRKG